MKNNVQPAICGHPLELYFYSPCINPGYSFLLITAAQSSSTLSVIKTSFSPNTVSPQLVVTDLSNASTLTTSLCYSNMKILEDYSTFLMHFSNWRYKKQAITYYIWSRMTLCYFVQIRKSHKLALSAINFQEIMTYFSLCLHTFHSLCRSNR